MTIHWKDWCWSWNSNTLATYAKNWFIGKDPDAGKDWRQEEKVKTEDEIVGWHHQLNGHEFEQAPWVSDGQGSPVCCSSWGREESDMTEWVKWLTALSSASLLNKSWFCGRSHFLEFPYGFLLVSAACFSAPCVSKLMINEVLSVSGVILIWIL